jgi:hypothetical protein
MMKGKSIMTKTTKAKKIGRIVGFGRDVIGLSPP